MPRARCTDEMSTVHLSALGRCDRSPSPAPNHIMDAGEYRRRGYEMVEYIADYLENIRERRVFPDVKPGYMRELIPSEAPEHSEPWDDIFRDVERVIMPGVTHWQSPNMHAYFPALTSYPSLLGDMLADAINCLGFTWASSPAVTELEMIVMDWIGKMINLPPEFLHSSPGDGGGVIQTTASEATFVSLLAARTEAIQTHQLRFPDLDDAEINSRLVGYCSDQAHSSVEKAGLIGLVKMRYIESDEKLSMRGDELAAAITSDREKGLIPFFLCATLGTTGACSFDNLEELGPICEKENIWMHVDAAYAGAALICPEFRTFMKGVEYAKSFAFNASKWLLVHFDCTCMWVKNSGSLHRTFNVDPIYLQHENTGIAIDYMHWQIGLSKRFRALKVWFVLRNYGIVGLQSHIRESVRMAAKFEAFVHSDPRFEIPYERHMGMVVFRLIGENELTEKLLKKLNSSGQLHCVPASLRGTYVIRFTVTSPHTTVEDLTRNWSFIRHVASEVLASTASVEHKTRVPLKETRKNPNFGTSLLLANSPMSPKIVNGSFAAIFDNNDVLYEFAKKLQQLKLDVKDSPGRAMRRRIRGMLMSGKHYSLDSRMDLVQSVAASKDQDDDSKENHLPPMRESSMESANNFDGSYNLQTLDTACQTELDLLFNGGNLRHRSLSVDGNMDDLVADTRGPKKINEVLSVHNAEGGKGLMVRELERGTGALRQQGTVYCRHCGTEFAANR
ncbi:histidine decarboxylase isoform X2 [Hyalella azteca]|uniref:Histidine decarboxylase n=1 Tax=Hyalella azteca TaxID=294128 RepID=A0A979FGH5_HYAAZ|nr:histidine decarboxylase isoform X2 [Hyalella azteca]